MAASAGPTAIDELRHRYAAQPRRYLAPLASALRQQGAVEEATTMLRAQLAVYPDHLTGHVVLGQVLFDTGALADASAAFERARALDPGNRVVLRYLGDIASLAGDAAAARVWFGRLRAADPYADDVAAQLGGAGVPPDAYEDEAPVAVAAEREVVEAPAAGAPLTDAPAASFESFELLEFGAAPVVDASASETPPLAAADLDPVVGLDLPPAAAPAELRDAGVGEDDGALDQIAAGPFATETMARLLAAQGHTEQAIALYERLLAERPDDAGLRGRLDVLRGAPAPDGPAPNVPPAGVTESAPVAPDDRARGALLAAAFADVPARVRGERAEPSVEQSVEHATPPDEADPFAAFSFDQFFPAPDADPAPAAGGPDDADLARFDAWLRRTS